MHRDESAVVQERLERDLLKRRVAAAPGAAEAVEPESKRTAQAGSSAGLAATEAAEAVPPGTTSTANPRA
eukprot:2465875-Amphidinium_carterae.1